MTVTAEVVEDLGTEQQVVFPVNASRVSAEAVRAAMEVADDDEGTLLADDRRALFTATVDFRRTLRVGGSIELAVDPGHLHFFDPATGTALAD
jgi:multiple sugar transport system ATP-binding protein